MKDLGPLHYFLGIDVHRSLSGFFLHQGKYAEDILDRVGMLICKPPPTLVDTCPKSSTSTDESVTNVLFYRSIVGALYYLTLTRPNIAYAVHQACLHMHAPRDSHWALIKRILRYIRGTTQHGVHLLASFDALVMTYSDVDWARCPDTRRSTSYYCIFLGHSLVSWSSKRQTTVSCSSAEVEYRGRRQCHCGMLLALTTPSRATHRH
jgi:hypothetical protein